MQKLKNMCTFPSQVLLNMEVYITVEHVVDYLTLQLSWGEFGNYFGAIACLCHSVELN